MNALLRGGLAGLAATAPMTAFGLAALQLLPEREQYALPPEEITAEVAQAAGLDAVAAEPTARRAASGVNHFLYGGACGAVYALTAARLPGSPLVKGCAFGMAVWAGSYLGWLPAAGILRPATEHPMRRNALMIAAHFVWGATAALVEEAARREG
ncbi:MAG TPA: DUF6789 family protein [Deinococcales bacterium]|nr:DUF6789 family protein [Deinococcales bacterium]